jgi:hypothetical protein
MTQANTNSRIGATDEIDNFLDVACGCGGGWWTSLYSGIVYDDHDGGCGSYPREFYDDDAEYQKRSALHQEVIPVFSRLRELEAAESQLARRGFQLTDPRVVRVRALREMELRKLERAHWLTDHY